jgi:SAM-dependent methyltransferase
MLRSMSEHDPYRSPFHYDLEYADYTEDIDWYVDLARKAGGTVLELGCGTGRITLALAEAGATVHGVDENAAMLRALEQKLRGLPDVVRWRVRHEQRDFRTLEGPPRYPLVLLPFNTIHHCRDGADATAVFEAVGRVLLPGGRFALDCYLPWPELYARDPDQRYAERTWLDPRSGVPIDSWEQSRWDPDSSVHHVIYTYQARGQDPHVVHLDLRMFPLDELRALIEAAGWRIVHEASDFTGAAMAPESTKCVLVLRR